MKSLIIILTILLSFSLESTSQITDKGRIEIEVERGYIGAHLVELEENGFVIISENVIPSRRNSEWNYNSYNTNLEYTQNTKLVLPRKQEKVEAHYKKDYYHSLFKDQRGNYTLASFNATTNDITNVNGVLPRKTNMKAMTVSGDKAFFIAQLKKEQFLFSVDWRTGKRTIIRLGFEGTPSKKLYVNNFEIVGNNIFVYVNVKIETAKIETYIVRLDKDGDFLNKIQFSKNIDKKIISLSATEINKEEFAFTGTYASKSTEVKFASLFSVNRSAGTGSAEGLFFCKANTKEVRDLKFYNFTELDNFMSFIPDRKKQRIVRVSERKEKKGKEFILKYNIASHKVITLDDGYLHIGEAYHPTYRTETYTSVGPNGVVTTHTRQVFDGYQYTHALIVKYALDGEKIWDHSFKMYPNFKPMYVKRFISIAEQSQSEIKLVFSSSDEIVTKSIGFDGSIQLERKSTIISGLREGDKTKFSSSNVDFWYDQFFIVYGRQTLINTKDDDKRRKRTIYYVNKVQFE
ncbi:MAG: hypothetical protein HRT72_04345 [Flavobacteriales bacterium]|nr:hypothetical protein [Flavobacteriales bacterium]